MFGVEFHPQIPLRRRYFFINCRFSSGSLPSFFPHAFPESKIGASHSGELRYVFGVFPGQPSEQERKISLDMQTYWTNFARTGDPNGNGLPAWPKFDSTAHRYLEFTDNGAVQKENLRRDYCDLFAENLKLRMGRLN